MNDRIIGQDLTIRLCGGSTVERASLSIENGKRVFRTPNGERISNVDSIASGRLNVAPGLFAMICAKCPMEEP